MLVTTVITTFKRPPELVERAIKSALTQTYKNIEIIVVDDSPVEYMYRNDVKFMVQSYSNYGVKYVEMPVSSGACAARNVGLDHARGEYIAFLDDDDEWLPRKIEKQIEVFKDNDVALVYCGRKIFYEDTKKNVVNLGAGYVGKVSKKLWEKGNFIGSTSFPLIRTSVLRKINGFDVKLSAAQDFDVWLRIANEYSIGYVREVLVIYHVHKGEQITKDHSKKIYALKRIMKKNSDFLNLHPEIKAIRRLRLLPEYLANENIKMAILSLYYAFFNYPSNIKGNILGLVMILEFFMNRKH